MPGTDDTFGEELTGEALVLAEQVAQVVQRIRKAEGYTLEELADRAGLHRTHIGLVERGERHLSIAAAARIASALGLTLADLIAEAERELPGHTAEAAALVPGSPVEVVRRPPKRRVNPDHFRNEDSLRELTGLGMEWIASAIESCYDTLDLIDEKMVESGGEPVAKLVELANLSSMIGNLLGGGLARASNGTYERNRPHAYPDLLSQHRKIPDAEIKTALEKNKPKGHLPKPGLHLTFRYVLGDRAGRYTQGKENRGETVWIWEARVGLLTAEDYDLSNTEGDSGKTAVIRTTAFRRMARVLYVPEFYPYGRRDGPWGDEGHVLTL